MLSSLQLSITTIKFTVPSGSMCYQANGRKVHPVIKHPLALYLPAAQYCMRHFIIAIPGIIASADFDPSDRAVSFKVCELWA